MKIEPLAKGGERRELKRAAGDASLATLGEGQAFLASLTLAKKS
jgi:hypothetical protein